jgi:hypothetical protein
MFHHSDIISGCFNCFRRHLDIICEHGFDEFSCHYCINDIDGFGVNIFNSIIDYIFSFLSLVLLSIFVIICRYIMIITLLFYIISTILLFIIVNFVSLYAHFFFV